MTVISISFNFSAKDAEKLFDADYKECKAVFIKCNKLEDAALEYMIKCYTSSSSVKAILKALLQIKDSATKANSAIGTVISNSGKRRQKRQKSTTVVSCSKFVTEVTTLTGVS